MAERIRYIKPSTFAREALFIEVMRTNLNHLVESFDFDRPFIKIIGTGLNILYWIKSCLLH